MPLFLDVHNIEGGVSAKDVADAHAKVNVEPDLVAQLGRLGETPPARVSVALARLVNHAGGGAANLLDGAWLGVVVDDGHARTRAVRVSLLICG